MSQTATFSSFRVEKQRVEGSITLSNGETVHGCFFVAVSGPLSEGPESVGQLLNADEHFFPFERTGPGAPATSLYNRSHVVVVALSEPEARSVPGYDVAPARAVSLLLSTGARILGSVRVYQPFGHDRVSDWARDRHRFQYVETNGATLLVNVHHVLEVREHGEG